MKKTTAKPNSQLAKLLPLLLFLYVPILLGIAIVVLIYLRTDLPPRIFFIDPVAEFNAPMYVGLISNFGVLLWCAAASICLLCGWIVFQSGDNRELAWFLICAGLVSALLMFDDLYLLHEEVLPDHLHIPQKIVFLAYGALVLGFLVRFRQMILNTEFMLLGLAFGFFAVSAVVDLFVTPEEFVVFGSIPGRHVIEDGCKLLGIATWSAYFIRTCLQKITPLLHFSETGQ